MKERIPKFTVFQKRRIWYGALLLISTIYVFYYRKEIYQIERLNTQNLIFLIWLLLLLFPLFSEVELFGIKMKKEIEAATKDIKNVINLQTSVLQSQINNSLLSNIHIENNTMPTWERMNEIEEELKKLREKNKIEPIAKEDIDKLFEEKVSNTLQIDENNIYLFKTRLSIERYLKSLCEKCGVEHKNSTSEMVYKLRKKEILQALTADLILQVSKITNKAAQGEFIDNEYIDFVKNTYPEIEIELKKAIQGLNFISCPKCKYIGYSKYENECPMCGEIFEE